MKPTPEYTAAAVCGLTVIVSSFPRRYWKGAIQADIDPNRSTSLKQVSSVSTSGRRVNEFKKMKPAPSFYGAGNASPNARTRRHSSDGTAIQGAGRGGCCNNKCGCICSVDIRELIIWVCRMRTTYIRRFDIGGEVSVPIPCTALVASFHVSCLSLALTSGPFLSTNWYM